MTNIELGHGVSVVKINDRWVIKDHNTFLSMETALPHKAALELAMVELQKLIDKESTK